MGHDDRADRRPGRGSLSDGRSGRRWSRPPGTDSARRAGFIGLAFLAVAAGTVEADEAIAVAGPEPVAFAPIHEGGIRKQRAFAVTPVLRLAPARQLDIGYTASNSYLNPSQLCDDQGQCPVEYETDHVGNLFFVDFSQPLGRAFELGIGIGSYRLDEIPRWALPQRLASDGVIRRFHEHLLGEESLPGLSGAPDGRQQFDFRDPDGRELRLEQGYDYVLPLRVDLRRYFPFGHSPDARMAVKLGLHAAGPLGGQSTVVRGQPALVRGIDVGLSADFLRSARLTANLSQTFYIQIARFRSDVHVADERSPLNADDTMRSQYALLWGLRFGATFGGRAPCSFSLAQLSNSAHFDHGTYWAWDPLVFEGGNNVRGALAGANDYGVIAFGCERQRQAYQIAFVEDLGGVSQFVSDDGAGTSYDPDFAVGFTASFSLGRRSRD